MPFAGNEIPAFDPSQPVGKRFSVYRWRVPSPDDYTPGRGFYLSSEGLECDVRGSSFRLRLEWANDILREKGYRRLAETSGYFTDHVQGETLKPIVARLNHSRGFVPGWTMGNGMASSINYRTIYTTPEDAAIAAHSDAEYDAEKEREYQERERERIEAEERERIEAQERAEDGRKLAADDRAKTMTERYNGWTNYETWNCKLWMDNDEGAQGYWAERAQEAYDAAEADGTFTRVERATLDLSRMLESEHEENAPELGASFYADMLNAALSEVNWHEIAESLIGEVDDQDKAEPQED